MKLIILPGFSPKNKKWADEVKDYLKHDFDVIIHEWKHWETANNSDFNLEGEAQSVVKKINKDDFLIAKSIGTYVSLFLPLHNLKKVILCGIPIEDLDEAEKGTYKKLSDYNSRNILIFQNDNDHHGTYDRLNKLLENFDLDLNVVKKSRSDHEYPYFEDFKKFLTSGI